MIRKWYQRGTGDQKGTLKVYTHFCCHQPAAGVHVRIYLPAARARRAGAATRGQSICFVLSLLGVGGIFLLRIDRHGRNESIILNRSWTPFVTVSTSMCSSAAAFVSSTRPRHTSPSHRVKPSFLRGLRRVVDCRIRSPAAHHPVRFSSSSQGTGGEGPSSKFLVIQVPRSSVVFHGSRHSGFSRSRRFRDPAGSSGFPQYFSGSHPFSEFQGFHPDFVAAPTFGEVWLSPKVWLSSKVWLSPEV